MQSVFELRREYGDNYSTLLPDGTLIPWRILTLEEFLKYNSLIQEGRFPVATIEDEIFKQVVLDENYVLNISVLPAGNITTVVNQVLSTSGPHSVDQLNVDLDSARMTASDFLHESVAIICQTFQACDPLEVFRLPYKEVMKLLAMAERRLLAMGIMEEPLQATGGDGEEQAPQRREVEFRDLNPPVRPPPRPNPTTKKEQDFVVRGGDTGEAFLHLTGHEQQNNVLWQHDLFDGMDQIYPEYMDMMKEGKKITPDVIKDTKGRTEHDVVQKHKQYTQDVLSGKIDHRPSAPLIAHGEQQRDRPVVRRKKRR